MTVRLGPHRRLWRNARICLAPFATARYGAGLLLRPTSLERGLNDFTELDQQFWVG